MPVATEVNFYSQHALTRGKQGNLITKPDETQRSNDVTTNNLDRIVGMMRRFFKIPLNVFEADEECRQAVLDGMNLCLQYGLTPGYHVIVRRIGGEWAADAGYRAWLDCANAAARDGRFVYDVQIVELTDTEVRDHSQPGQYIAGDVGYAARVVRSDKAEMYRTLAADYDPPFSYGFWHKRGYPEIGIDGQPTGNWLPDPIFSGRDSSYTARLRATKAALMDSFSLIPLDHLTPVQRLQSLHNLLSAELSELNRKPAPGERSLMAERNANPDDDGDLLWA